MKNLSLDISLGEVLLVVGRSGSGKTTFLRCLAGVAHLYNLRIEGSIRVCGYEPDPSKIARFVTYVPQEPWASIACPYPFTELLSFTQASMKDIEIVAKELGIYDKLFDSSTNLSAGEIQRICVAEALLSKKKLVLLDEVSAYLDSENRRRIAKLVDELRKSGSTVVVVDHDLELWRGIVDRVLYLDGGEAIVLNSVDETPIYEEIRRLYKFEMFRRYTKSGEIVLEARDVWYRYPDSDRFVVSGFTADAVEGEILWIRGGSGRGKSTILKLLAGIYRPSRGYVRRYVEKLQLVPENPFLYLSNPTPREELGSRIDLARELDLIDVLDTPIALLSSGERRRLAIASAYARASRLLLVDEPCIGLDPWNARRVLNVLDTLRSRGCTIIVASHSRYLELVADRIVEV